MCLFVGSFMVYCINMYVTAAVQCLPAQQKLLDVQDRLVLCCLETLALFYKLWLSQ